MLNRKEIIKDIEENKIIVIMRGFSAEQLIRSVDAMEKGGIRLVEVTFDQTGAISDNMTAEYISTLKENFNGRVRIGAGTVMTEKQVELAYNAGAEFIISPDCYEAVIKKTRELGMVSIPGAFTPTEAANAHRFGADFGVNNEPPAIEWAIMVILLNRMSISMTTVDTLVIVAT